MYPYEGWANSHLTVHATNGEEWQVTCPNPNHPDNNPSCYFNVRKGTYHCFACGHSGGMGAGQDRDLQVELLEFEIARLLNPEVEDEDTVHTIPESSLARYDFPTPYWTDERHLRQDIVDMFDLGYDAINNAATIPERTPDGDLIGVTRRFLDTTGNDRYRYPKGFKKSHNMFASWIDADFTEVAILEGAIDTMKVWQVGMPALAIYGAQVSTFHIQLMKELGVKKIVWIGDGDEAGKRGLMRSRGLIHQVDGRYKYRKELDMSKHFLLYSATDHQGKKDTGAMTDEEVLATIESQEPFVPDVTVSYIKRRSRVY